MNVPYWLKPLQWEMEQSMVVLKWVVFAYVAIGTAALMMFGAYMLLH